MDRLHAQGVTATNANEDNMLGVKNGIDDSVEDVLVEKVMGLFQRHDLRMKQSLGNSDGFILECYVLGHVLHELATSLLGVFGDREFQVLEI